MSSWILVVYAYMKVYLMLKNPSKLVVITYKSSNKSSYSLKLLVSKSLFKTPHKTTSELIKSAHCPLGLQVIVVLAHLLPTIYVSHWANKNFILVNVSTSSSNLLKKCNNRTQKCSLCQKVEKPS